MTQPDYLKARALVEAWQRNPGVAGEPDLQTRIAQALEDAHLAGRREGIEEERGRFKLWGTEECRSCDAGRITLYHLSELCVECQSRALLRGGKK